MKAAVITSFDAPPRYLDIADPVPDGPGELLVDVLAAGLHHVTRGRARCAPSKISVATRARAKDIK